MPNKELSWFGPGIRKEAYEKDIEVGRNAEEATALMMWILQFVNDNSPVTADQIYEKSECGDIAMYLALHHLVTNGMIKGPSPYHEDQEGTKHTEWVYKKNPHMEGMPGIMGMAKHWNPEDWRE
jgi:hypothetical protein